jgi:hypothetical protein
MELSMSETNTVSPLRQRMIEDMTARKLVEIASGIEPVQDGRIYRCAKRTCSAYSRAGPMASSSRRLSKARSGLTCLEPHVGWA